MKRECIICRKVYGESGDLTNGSVSGGICDDCQPTLEVFYYCRRRYRETGSQWWVILGNYFWERLKEREENGKSNSG